jgi:hypothetical protein
VVVLPVMPLHHHAEGAISAGLPVVSLVMVYLDGSEAANMPIRVKAVEGALRGMHTYRDGHQAQLVPPPYAKAYN